MNNQMITTKTMKPISKKRRSSMKGERKDRLSELPDELLVHILSFLPILDAVRTVSLRRFGNLWRLLPSLIFEDSEILQQQKWPSKVEESIPRFATFVRNVIILHRRIPIDQFRLCFYEEDVYNDDHESFVGEITSWIRFAIDRQVKELEVQFAFEVNASILPHCVFTSQSLVKLSLVNCEFYGLSRVEMRSLRKLMFRCVYFYREICEKIIQGSPSLQELVMKNVFGLDELCFTAPNIELLQIDFLIDSLVCPNLKILNFDLDYVGYEDFPKLVDVSSVREVNIGSCDNLDVFRELLNKFRNAEVFRFSDEGFQLSKIKEQNFPKIRWKRLHITSDLHPDNFLGICRILRSSPHLEELILYTNSLNALGVTPEDDMHSLEQSSCLMQCLKSVTMRGYKVPCDGMLRLAEILLKSSVNLEKMVILPSRYNSTAVDKLEFVKQLLSYPRASTNARVIFDSHIY